MWPNGRLTPYSPSLTIVRTDSASLSCLWKTTVVLAGTVLMQSMLIWANWIANSETKAAGLDRAFTRRGIHFYNKTENVVVWVFLNTKHKRTYAIEKSHFIPFVLFLPPKELKMVSMTNKILQFWS